MTVPDLGNPDTYSHGFPHDVFAQLRRDNPVAWCPEPAGADFEGGPGFWIVTRHQDIVEAGTHPEVFSSHRGGTAIRDLRPRDLRALQQMMLNIDPPEHSSMRKVINKAFTPKVVRAMQDSMEEHARAVVDGLGEGGDLDLVGTFSAEMPLLVLADILGIPAVERHLLYDWTNRMVGFDDPAANTPTSYVAAFAELFAYAHELTKHKRAHPTEDVWSLVVNAEVDGERLSDDELDRFFQLLVIAGNETTRNLLTGTILTLSQHPDQWQLLRDDPGVLPSTIEEVLRFHSPVMQFRRTAVQDFKLGGQLIRDGEKVVLSYASANRDEAVFSEPDRFDVMRGHNPHLAFGSGPHFCLGHAVARLEARVILPALFSRFPTIKVTGEPVRLRSNFINGISELPVHLSTRVPISA